MLSAFFTQMNWPDGPSPSAISRPPPWKRSVWIICLSSSTYPSWVAIY